MANLEFTKNAQGQWECEATVSGVSDLRIVQTATPAGKFLNTVALFWKGDVADVEYAAVQGSSSVPANGVYNKIITSEYYPVYVKIVTSSNPTAARLTDRSE